MQTNTIQLLNALLEEALLTRRAPEVATVSSLLELIKQQGHVLQARILLTASPIGDQYLPLLPAVQWFEECWPGQHWTQTFPCAKQDTPYFSVVTPSYNQAIYLKDTIQSILCQNFPSFEHIVMDGGSTDGTLDLLKSYPHLQWVSEKDRGQTHALNKALSQARGEVIAWLNSDDFYLPDTFALVHEYFTKHPEESIVTGDCLWGWESSGRLRYISGKERDFESLIRQWNGHVPGPQPSIFFKRALIEECGLGDESMHYGMDYDFWLRMALKGHIRRHLPIPVAFYRFHQLSKSGAEQDWTLFYKDWQACFTRYRQHSTLLPKQTLLAVTYPLRKDASAKERATLCAALKLCAQWKMRDIELVLVTDIPHMQNEKISAHEQSTALHQALPGLPPLSLPLSIAHVTQLNTKNFLHAAVHTATSFALCMPPIDTLIPFEQWYETPLNALIDHTNATAVSLLLPKSKTCAMHPLLPHEGFASALCMHRREALLHALP